MELTIVDTKDNKQPPMPLSVELMGALLKQGKRIIDIANYTGQARGNVSRYYKQHLEELQYLRDTQNNIAATMYKRIEYHATKRQIDIYNDTKAVQKVSASQSAIIGGIATEKRRLLEGESTQNVSVSAINTNMKERQAQREALQAELADM